MALETVSRKTKISVKSKKFIVKGLMMTASEKAAQDNLKLKIVLKGNSNHIMMI